ncbi:MAG: cupin domain-containing protein [Alphaproteobacteria bacterium]|nr:cupin domain-containing protein [Alphaproteobacteria bacterium]
METKVRHITQAPVQTGTPASIANPIRPEQFADKYEAQLTKLVDVTQFGVNHVKLEPGAISSLRHWHEGEDELVYVLSGELALIDDNGEHVLQEGSFVGFPAGRANAHHLINKSAAPAVFLAIGTRKVGEEVIHYPDDAIGPVKVRRDAKGNRVVP